MVSICVTGGGQDAGLELFAALQRGEPWPVLLPVRETVHLPPRATTDVSACLSVVVLWRRGLKAEPVGVEIASKLHLPSNPSCCFGLLRLMCIRSAGPVMPQRMTCVVGDQRTTSAPTLALPRNRTARSLQPSALDSKTVGRNTAASPANWSPPFRPGRSLQRRLDYRA